MSSVRNVAVSVLGNTVPPATALLAAPLLARALGPIGRGESGAATAPLVLLAAGLTLGLPEACTYFTARGSVGAAIARRAALLLVAVGVLATVGTLLLGPALAVGDRGLAALLTLCTAAVVPSLLVALLRGIAAGLGRWGLIALERGASALLRLAVLALLWAAGELTVVSASLVIAFVPVLSLLVYLPVRPPGGRRGTTTRALLSFGVRLWPGALGGILLARVDQVLMLPLAGARELGLYVVAVSISEVPLVFNTAVREVLFAEESGRGDVVRLARAARISTLVTAVVAAIGALLAVPLVPVLFGDGFTAALPALWVLLVAVVAGNPGSVAGAGLSARGRPGLRSWSILVALVVDLIVLALFAPLLGALGAAIGTLAGNIVAGGLNLLWLRRLNAGRAQFVGFTRGDVSLLLIKAQAVLSRSR